MTSYLLKKLIGLAICVATLIVGYNFFWGNEEEQASSRKIIAQVKDLTGSVTKLLSSEKEKYEDGKYDDALSKMKQTIAVMKQKAMAMGDSGKQLMDKVNDLERREEQLKQDLAGLKENGPATGRMMMAPPGATPESAAEPTPSDSNAEENRDRRADAIRRQLLELNQEAERMTADFT